MNNGTDESLEIGEITGCHGIKGWVKVHSYTDPPENFSELGPWELHRRGGVQPVQFDAIRRQGKGLVAHIVGVDDRTLAETYRGARVTVPVDRLPALARGDYYWRQLEGLQVWCHTPGKDSDRLLLGTVDYLIETGANDVLVVKASDGSIDQRERLIPYLPGDVVTDVDLDKGIIEVSWFPDD